MQEKGGRWSTKSTFCKLLYHRKCKQRGVGGQKKPNLVNVVSERPLTLSYRKLIEIIGWFKRWIYENGDKESVLTLRMPTMPETLDFLFLVMLCSMICAIISGMFKTGIWKDKGHGKSYKIESGK